MIGGHLMLAQAAVPSTLLDGLAGFWKLDGDANDALGVSNGTVQGTGSSWSTGKVGSAFYTPGTARVNVGGNAQIKPTTAISVAGWFWFTAGATNMRVCSDWHQEGGKDRWIMGYSPDGSTVHAHMGVNCLLGSIGSTIPTSQWVHLTLTAGFISLGAYAMTTYRNGAPVATATGSTLWRSGAGNVCLGLQEESGAGLYGRLDEVGIWNRALTPTEVAELYNAGAGKTYPF